MPLLMPKCWARPLRSPPSVQTGPGYVQRHATSSALPEKCSGSVLLSYIHPKLRFPTVGPALHGGGYKGRVQMLCKKVSRLGIRCIRRHASNSRGRHALKSFLNKLR